MGESRSLAGKKDLLRRRDAMLKAIRSFFAHRDYLEVETAHMIPAPAPEVHIDAVSCGSGYLHTSPELCMKRLLAAEYPRIFQICKCFRSGERGASHLPVFTVLEWYHAGIGYMDLMKECEELLSHVFFELGCGEALAYQGRRISLKPPWERITVAAAFSLHAPMALSRALERDCFEEVLTEHVEPHLGVSAPTFVYDYPLHTGALAKAKKENAALAERFELYIGGLELANAFSELTDAEEQRARFQDAERMRLAMGKSAYPSVEIFLHALSVMPDAAGIALGIDRLAMIVTDSRTIDDVVAFVPEDL
ncbi:MAG: EF-P lysine aminoacylase GenX [Syntrophales bacterium LBB04]|nr:EF-P lysine aminoacylase GenX [Syntrophales bacterium LBB04]